MKTLKIGKNSITISPEEGLYINSLVLGGVEVSKVYYDGENKKRGGIFAMIPNSGPSKNEIPQHGFVRINSGKIINNYDKNIISQKISFNKNDFKNYPFDYEVINNNILFDNEDKVKIEFIIKNIGEEKMPISIGFHPYFIVKDIFKENILWDFKKGEDIKNNLKLRKTGGTYFFDNFEKKYNFVVPDIGKIEINFSENFKKIWVWSPKNGDSVCFEPNMNNYFGLEENPSYIKGGEEEIFFMEISLINKIKKS